MFLDQVKLSLIAGTGGNGVIAWRREKYIPKGGPAGGDGGHGGNIYIEADPQLLALESFRNQKIIRSQNGKSGSSGNKKGANGQDIFLKVPMGTIVKNSATSELLFECIVPHQKHLICRGGMGGRGNTCFKSPTQQAPYICTEGTEGETKEVELELKLIADIGLIGMPNAGKSTLLAHLAHIEVKAAPYPFTTLYPNLGVVTLDNYTRLHLADIPGIIQDAHKNRGLGLSFLKHIERTSLLLFVIDISAMEERDPFEDFLLLRHEIECYRKEILEKPFLVLLNKIDMDPSRQNADLFKKRYPFPQETLFEISALASTGFAPLMQAIERLTTKAQPSSAPRSPLLFVS